MFAVMKTGGKQYCVEKGSQLEIEKITGDIGDNVRFDEVLLLANEERVSIGQPNVKGATVVCEIIDQKLAPKLTIFKKIRRHGKRLKKGHRQQLTKVVVKEISVLQ